jgi:hypothetical protein
VLSGQSIVNPESNQEGQRAQVSMSLEWENLNHGSQESKNAIAEQVQATTEAQSP